MKIILKNIPYSAYGLWLLYRRNYYNAKLGKKFFGFNGTAENDEY